MTLKDNLLSSGALKPVKINAGEGAWSEIYIRRFTGAQRGDWERYNTAQVVRDDKGEISNPAAWRCKLVQLSVVDENNTLVFEPGDMPRLFGIDGAIIAEIFTASTRINKLSAYEVKAAVADFFPTPKTSTGTDLPPSSDTPV